MSVTSGKVCFIPSCENTSQNAPVKIFLHVPRQQYRRIRWFQTAGVTTTQTQLFCCEDHFNLAEDCVNWMYFKTVGSKLELKKDVVPHRNLLSSNIPKTESQFCSSDKKRKLDLIKNLKTQTVVKKRGRARR